MTRVRLTLRAKAQLRLFARNLEDVRVGHGVHFISDVRKLLGLVAAFPEMGLVYYRDVRRALVQRYSCLILYRVIEGEVVVVKFADARR